MTHKGVRHKLRNVRSVKELGVWMQKQGFTPGENAHFGRVHAVHTSTSLHYKRMRNGVPTKRQDLQGNLALDVNDNDVKDDKMPFDDEGEALRWLYEKILSVARARKWPLDEMFHGNKGFIKEKGYGHNHPISAHDHHLHVAFYKARW